MVSGKKRLYVALYPSGVRNKEERRYHWAFLIGPKTEKTDDTPGMKLHVKNPPLEGWQYEEKELKNVRNTVDLLVRILIAKIEDDELLLKIIRETPVVQGDPEWRCRTWIADALGRMAKDPKAVGTTKLDWRTIETMARRYAAEKIAAGCFSSGADLSKPKPTWDLLQDKEIVP